MKQGLRIENIHVHYGKTCAIESISLHIRSQQLIALVGKNGSGKTTLLKTICGLVKPNQGHLTWSEKPIDASTGCIAYFPQRETVDWNFPITVRGLVEMGRFPHIGWFGRFSQDDQKKVDQALRQMNLMEIQNRQINALSGGQQQRTFIARALAQQADVLLLDEAFNGLDYPAQQHLAELLNNVARAGPLVIISHHDLKTLDQYFDHAIILNQRLVHCGPLDPAALPQQLQEAELHG